MTMHRSTTRALIEARKRLFRKDDYVDTGEAIIYIAQLETALKVYAQMDTNPPEEEHVFLVALQVKGRTREEAEKVALSYLPNHPSPDTTPGLECWWVAEDDRHDRSDNDSAVFVHPGSQVYAAALLVAHGLTPEHNVPVRDSHFEAQS